MTEYVLTIDLGTSGPKVAIFTFDGSFVDGDFTPVELNVLPDGGVEQSPAEWWSGVVGAAQRLMARTPVPSGDVVAVAVTSQWSGTVPIDRDGTPLHDAIIWMDARGADETRRVVGGALRVQGYDPRKLRTWISRTGGAPALSGKDSVSHILWLQRERPEIARATWKYLEPKDWLNFQLTGRCAATHDSIVLHWVTDNRDATRVDYDPGLLRIAQLDRAQLPDLVPATSVLGGLTEKAAAELGVPAGIAVIGGTPDLQSAAIGSGAVHDFEGHLYVGTSSWLTCHVPFKKTDLFHGIASLPSPLPGKYYVADEQEVAGGCLEWLREHALETGDDFRQLDVLAGSVAPGSNGVIFTPWLNGERTPVDDHTLRAGWSNMSLATTRSELVRSVLEGVAYNSRWLLETVEKFVGRPFPWLHFIGGGAQSELWCRIMADVLDREIRQVEHPIRANARGAALLAGIALGRIGIDDLARNVRIVATFAPDSANRAVYDDRYAEFRVLHKRAGGANGMSVARPERMRDDSFPMRGWGLPDDGELGRVVIISPHLDDAVLSCGGFMAVHPGVTVVTVFAGNPPAYPVPMRVWDVQSGFGPEDDVMEARRDEDRAALAKLDASPVHLDFIEHSYNPQDRPVAPELIADGLVAALGPLEPTLVLAPFGLANPDHDVTHRGCMSARDRVAATVSWWCYEDNGYKHIPGMLAWRVSSLFRRRLWPTPVCPPVDHGGERKADAVACYPSQLLALEDDWRIAAKLAAPAPEQFWRLAPPPAGWEGLAAD